MPKPKDPETTAMQTIALVLAPLAQFERDRIGRWVYDRYVAEPTAPLVDDASPKTDR